MEIKKYEQIAYDEAKRSKCLERKVGAILVDTESNIIMGQGYNHSPICKCLEFSETKHYASIKCPGSVLHAEIACLNNTSAKHPSDIKGKDFLMVVTHPPCNQCLKSIEDFANVNKCIIDIHICEQFLKFDDSKVRFELVPPEWEEYDAKVLTYGAKKYKPDNWRRGEIKRYEGAVMRHWNAYRKGEWLDPETGLPHLAHMRTNIGFLITLENENEKHDN